MDAHIQVVTPRTMQEAAEVYAEHPDWTLLAGGTDVMVLMDQGQLTPTGVVDLSRCAGLDELRDDEGALQIGATVTHAQLADSALVRGRCPILAEACGQVGSRQIQHRGTLGGNLGNASPAGDTLPVLMACLAMVKLVGPDGTRLVNMDALYTGYRTLCTRPGEFIAGVVLPPPEPDTRFWFAKVGSRRAFYCSKVVLAGVGTVRGGTFAGISLAAGSVAPTVVRLEATERAIEGRDTAGVEAVAEAAAAATAEVQPIDDVRSTACYRQTVTANLIRRFVAELAAQTLPGITG